MSDEYQAEIESGMKQAYELGFEKGRRQLLDALSLVQSIAVPIPAVNYLEKSFDESKHPRDDSGRFISKGDIAAAAKDPDKAAELRQTTTDPEQRKKLDAAIEKKQKGEIDKNEKIDNKKIAKKDKEKQDGAKTKTFRKSPAKSGGDYSTLAAAVRSSGGIDPKSVDFLRFHSGVNEAMEYGIPLSVFRKGGMGLDVLAAEMHENGIMHTPEGKDHAEHLLEQLANKAKSALNDNTKEIEDAYHEHARNQYLASLEHSPDEIASATRLGEEDGAIEEDEFAPQSGSRNAGPFGGSGTAAQPEATGIDFEFGANETGASTSAKPAKRRTVEQTVKSLEKIAKRDTISAVDMAMIHEAINGHTHAEIAEVKKRLGIKASGSKAKQAADIASRILDRDKSDARKFNHPHLTVDEAKAHIEKFVNGGEPKPGDAVRLANALAGGLTTKQLVEIKKHYGIKASGAKSEMASKIAQRLAPKIVNDWSEQDAKLNSQSETIPVKPEQQPQLTAQAEAPAPTTEPTPTVSQGQPEAEPQKPARATDLFGNPLPKTWAKINSTQLDIEDQLKTAWVDHAHDFAKESGHKVSKIYAGGQFEANGKRYRVGLAEEGYPIHNDETDEVVREGQTSGPITNVKPQAGGTDLETKLKNHVADHIKQSAGKASKSERNTIPGSAPISDASRVSRDNAERSERIVNGTADAADITAYLGGPHATKSQLATRLAKFGIPEQDAKTWIDSLKPSGKAKTGTKQNTYDTLDIAKRLGLHQPKPETKEPAPTPAPARRAMAFEGQERPEHKRHDEEQTLTAEHATNPQHWDALAAAGQRDWLIQEAKRRGVGDQAKKMPARKIVELLRNSKG